MDDQGARAGLQPQAGRRGSLPGPGARAEPLSLSGSSGLEREAADTGEDSSGGMDVAEELFGWRVNGRQNLG